MQPSVLVCEPFEWFAPLHARRRGVLTAKKAKNLTFFIVILDWDEVIECAFPASTFYVISS
jgi:hypothetical protein